MNTDLNIGELVAVASVRLGLVLDPSARETLVEIMRNAIRSAPYALDAARMAEDMAGYTLPPDVIMSAKHAPDLIGQTIRDQETQHMPMECPFMVGYRVRLTMAFREKEMGRIAGERAVYAFYLIAYAIRLQRPVG